MILHPDGILKHGSLQAGERTIHQVQSRNFNPFDLPLAEPAGEPSAPVYHTQSFDESRQKTLNLLLTQPAEEEGHEIELNQAGAARAAYVPWRGYWWPYEGRPLSKGRNSPLGKFDRFMQGRTGENPGAMIWENRHHRYRGIWWEGHCNGWAAASILRAEPRLVRIDSDSGTAFSISDQKGLLSELDYCAKATMFGKRYNGRGDPLWDIAPDLFHKTLTYYIGTLHKPVITDYDRRSAVNNHIISAYQMEMEDRGPYHMTIKTTLTMHGYDTKIVDAPGAAPSYKKVYRYTLGLDRNGNLSGGRWLSENPDFLWVPLSLGSNCSQNNPNMKSAWVNALTGYGRN
jgi:hypothetical protein